MRLQPNRPFVGEQPAVTIDAGLPAGAHRFRLEVVGTSGLRSRPAEVVVVVASDSDDGRPESPYLSSSPPRSPSRRLVG
jgi:hypothetical protein